MYNKMLLSNKLTNIHLLLSIYSSFPLTLKAINLCAVLKILKLSVLALGEIEVGHSWIKAKKKERHSKFLLYLRARSFNHQL
jgi:hypothetical protein